MVMFSQKDNVPVEQNQRGYPSLLRCVCVCVCVAEPLRPLAPPLRGSRDHVAHVVKHVTQIVASIQPAQHRHVDPIRIIRLGRFGVIRVVTVDVKPTPPSS